MKDYEYPPLALPVSENFGDAMLHGGMSEDDDYFTEGEETFGDGVPRQVNAEVKRDPADIEALLREIESRMPDEVLELFGNQKSKKEEAA